MTPLIRRFLLISLCAIWPVGSSAGDSIPRVSVSVPTPLQPAAVPWTRRHPHEILDLLHARQFDVLDTWLNGGQSRYEQGELDETKLANAFGAFGMDSDPDSGSLFDDWMSQRPQSYAARLARGVYYLGNGWRSRGNEYAWKTPGHRFGKMSEFFAQARADLEKAVALTPKPIGALSALMEITGTEGDPVQLDALLNRALALDRSALTPRFKRLRFLEPRWGGSFAAMENFVAETRVGLDDTQFNSLAGAIPAAQASAIEHATPRKPGEDKQRHESALALVNQAIALAPDQAGYLGQKAKLLAALGQPEEAQQVFDRAIELSYGPHLYLDRGMLHADLRHDAAAIADFRMAAELGVVPAQQRMGWGYRMGAYGMARNPVEALKWFRRAAIWGDIYAQLMVGDLVREGAGGRPDLAEAARWYRLAAQDGYAPAQTNLGSMYWNGMGVEQSRWEGMRWWRYAAAQGDADAKRNIEHLLNPLDKLWMVIAEALFDPWRAPPKRP